MDDGARPTPEHSASLDAVRAVERTLETRDDRRADAERALAAASARGDQLVEAARRRAAQTSAALRARRLEDAEQQAGRIVRDARARAAALAAAMEPKREQTLTELVALVLPDQEPEG